MCRRAGSAALSGCPRVTCRHRPDRGFRSRRPRGGSWRCRRRGCDFMAADLSALDLLVVQIDGLHLGDDLVLVAAIGVDGEGNKHPLALVEGATENAVTVQALLDNLVSRGLAPTVPRLFIVDGAKALSKAIRRTFGSAAAIQP